MPLRTRVPNASRSTLKAASQWLAAASKNRGVDDPLMVLWQEWRGAFAASNRLCRDAQRLERKLVETIGYPRVAIPVEEPERSPLYATDAREIDRLLGISPATGALRQRLKRDLAGLQARWDAEADACGLTVAVEREGAADRRVDELLKAAATTPACSIAGVIAKLVIATEWGGREPEADGFPWTFLRGALTDLTTVATADKA